MKKVEVLYAIRRGIPDSPRVFKSTTKAEAYFDNLAEELLGEDMSEVDRHIDYGYRLIEANLLLEYKGLEIHWYEGIEINQS